MRVLGIVALAMALLGGGAAAQSPSAAPQADAQELLGFTVPDGSSRARLVLIRTTLEPGERLGDVGWGGSSVSWVQSGSLRIDVQAGTVTVAEANQDGGQIADGDSWTLGALGAVRADPETVMDWTNDDNVRTTVLTAAIIPADAGDPTANLDDSPGPTPTPGPKEAPPVLGTFVVRGTGPTGQPSTYTIRDQSGWVTGARVPTDRELRGWPLEARQAVGPVRATGPDTFDLLVRWSGTVCGPVITLTVELRLRAMRLVDRSPGCDAMAYPHALVLGLRTTVGMILRDIPLEQVRRYP